MTFPGIGDLLSGPCLGGACPHDHTVEATCEVCAGEYDTDDTDEGECPECRRLVELDPEDLREMVLQLRGELSVVERERDLARRET